MKTSYFGNSWIGMFARTNNEFTIVPVDAPKKFTDALESSLKTTCIKTTIGDTNLPGMYLAMNSNGIIAPNIIEDKEVKFLEKETGLEVYKNKDNHNANGNNIAVNDKGGIINPKINEKERVKIQETLGVELEPRQNSEYYTVGSNILINNKGFLAHYITSEEETEELKKAFKVSGLRGTINIGTGFIGVGAVANDNGYIVGESSTAYEMGRIEEALDLMKR